MKNKKSIVLTIVLWVVIIIWVLIMVKMVSNRSDEVLSPTPMVTLTPVSTPVPTIYTRIEGSGSPVVIFESGYGDDHMVWSSVQSEISKYTTTISYDRPGLGDSPDDGLPKTTEQQVDTLYKILVDNDIDGPYIYVAHSLGSFNARVFAGKYKDKVNGIILVDPAHEDQNKKIMASLPDNMKDQYLSQFTIEGTYDDMEDSVSLVKECNIKIKDIPMTIISADNHYLSEDLEKWIKQIHKDMASLSSNGRHVSVESGHYIQNDDPSIVINEIIEMIN